jgi:Cu-Zn family superoxide dismutase
MRVQSLFVVVLVAGVAGCASGQRSGTTRDAVGTARLRNAQGVEVGTVVLEQERNGVGLDVRVTGLPAGVHGIHLHGVGRCDAPDFTTAGAHFNPALHQHGFNNPQGPHAGDLRNLTVGANGVGRAELSDGNVTLGEGPTSLFDADGTSIVVHASADDYLTDPSGNSGARIACGVITR